MTTVPFDRPDPLAPNEAYGEGLVAPGQEALAQEFLQDQGQAELQPQGEELLLGKFKSVEDLARSYQALERKLGGKGPGEPPAAEAEPEAPAYTREAGVETYGEALADRFEEAGFDPFALNERLVSGEVDLAAAAKELATASGFSERVAEQFLRGGMAQAPAGEIGGQEQAEIMALVGGEDRFRALSNWAKDGGVDPERLAAYNAAVAAGNRPAIEAYLLWMNAQGELASRDQQEQAVIEPQLLGGQTPSKKAFANRSEAFEAMGKLDDRGNRLYDTDPKYREQVERLIAESDAF